MILDHKLNYFHCLQMLVKFVLESWINFFDYHFFVWLLLFYNFVCYYFISNNCFLIDVPEETLLFSDLSITVFFWVLKEIDKVELPTRFWIWTICWPSAIGDLISSFSGAPVSSLIFFSEFKFYWLAYLSGIHLILILLLSVPRSLDILSSSYFLVWLLKRCLQITTGTTETLSYYNQWIWAQSAIKSPYFFTN